MCLCVIIICHSPLGCWLPLIMCSLLFFEYWWQLKAPKSMMGLCVYTLNNTCRQMVNLQIHGDVMQHCLLKWNLIQVNLQQILEIWQQPNPIASYISSIHGVVYDKMFTLGGKVKPRSLMHICNPDVESARSAWWKFT